MPELAQTNEAMVREPGIEHTALPEVDPRSQQPWSSGMMEPSQGFDPGSIPGDCNLLTGQQKSQRPESNQRPCDRRHLQSHALPIELR